MSADLAILAIAPVAVLLAYVWFRDKYEHEPWHNPSIKPTLKWKKKF